MKFKDQVVYCRKLYLALKECKERFDTEYMKLLYIKRHINKDVSPTFHLSDYGDLLDKTILEFKEDLQQYNILARLWAKLTWRI